MRCFPILLVALSLIAGSVIHGQVTTATIYGRVVDPSGAVVATAEVSVTNQQRAVTRTTTTNERGEFTLAFLPVGEYRLTIESSGFKIFSEQGFSLSAGQTLNKTYPLEVGGATESVTVAAEAPMLNTSSAQGEVRLNSLQMRTLPMRNRDITGLLNLGTGVSSSGDLISINGMPPRGFSFAVDGVDASPDSEQASMSMYQDYNFIKGVSAEAVGEIEIAKNIFSAEIGNAISGNVNLITKSGSNEFHGSLFEYYQAGGMAAVNHLTSTKVPLVFHQFGASFGGPIMRNKLFFFTTYEGYRYTQRTQKSGTVPSVGLRNLIVAAIPESKPYFDIWPLPTELEKPGASTAFWTGSGAETRTDDHGVMRVDYNISSNDHLSTRYTRGHPNRQYPRLVPSVAWRLHDGLNENVGSSYTHVWSPTLTSETRFGFNRSITDRVDGTYLLGVPFFNGVGLPSLDQGKLFVKFGTVTSAEQTFSKMSGRHSMKFGVSYHFTTAGREAAEVPKYEFTTLADVRNKKLSTARYLFAVNPFQIRRWDLGFFGQDDIRLRPNLMVNLGVRYDYDSVPSERDDRIFNRYPFGPDRPHDSPWNAYYKMFSPRVGLAWTVDPAGKTVVRSGFGIFFMPHTLFSGLMDMVKNGPNAPFEVFLSASQIEALGIKYPFTSAQALPLVKASGIVSEPGIDPNRAEPYSLQWTFGIQRNLAKNLVWDVSYVGNHAVKTVYSPILNRVDRVTGLPQNPNFGQFRYIQNADSVVYNSLQTSLKKRFSNNIQLGVNYTYASNMSYYEADFSCCGGEGNGPQELDRLDLNRGPTPYHIQHNFSSDVLYEIPARYFAGNQFAKAILGGWQFSGILQARSGVPLLIQQSVGASPGQRPDFIGANLRDAIRADWKTPLPNGSYQYLRPELFANIPISPVSGAAIRPGNLSRYPLHGPGWFNTDITILKPVAISERRKLEIRATFFNALNHTNLTGMSLDTRSTSFGRITSTGPGRVTQLSARFQF